ncbi:MAG: ATP-binding protein [Allgaiera sp.]|jgi:signal transduction histidine kinase|nr:ATP-binding protein [Allgaiera sp.]
MAKAYSFEALGLLHGSVDESIRNIVTLTSRVLDAPNVYVSVLESENGQQYICGSVGQIFEELDSRKMPIEDSICKHVQSHRKTVAINDLLKDVRTMNNTFVIKSGIRTYIGSPIHTTTGKIIGALCCISPSPREWTQNDIALLEDLAHCVDGVVRARTFALQEREARLKVEQIMATRSSYVAHVSHEIRTPLTGIIGSIKMLSNVKSEEQSTRLLTILNRSADKLLAFVNDVLDLAKLDSGHAEMVEEEIDLGNLVREILSVFSGLAETKSINLNVDDQLAGKTYFAGRSAFQTILQNLIGNAVKFTDTGSVTVRIAEDSYGQAVIEVIDTGIGIAPEDHGRIFEEFELDGDSIARTYGGTGLGMPIVKRLVDRMDGTIKVESQPGQGATFKVSVPLQEVSQTEVAHSDQSAQLRIVAA